MCGVREAPPPRPPLYGGVELASRRLKEPVPGDQSGEPSRDEVLDAYIDHLPETSGDCLSAPDACMLSWPCGLRRGSQGRSMASSSWLSWPRQLSADAAARRPCASSAPGSPKAFIVPTPRPEA